MDIGFVDRGILGPLPTGPADEDGASATMLGKGTPGPDATTDAGPAGTTAGGGTGATAAGDAAGGGTAGSAGTGWAAAGRTDRTTAATAAAPDLAADWRDIFADLEVCRKRKAFIDCPLYRPRPRRHVERHGPGHHGRDGSKDS